MKRSAESHDRQNDFSGEVGEAAPLIHVTSSEADQSPYSSGSESYSESTLDELADVETAGHFANSSDPPEPYLIRGFLQKDPPLHMRRSLDQFYCIGMLDEQIGSLDVDQTVYKYFKKRNVQIPQVLTTGSSKTRSLGTEFSPENTLGSRAYEQLMQTVRQYRDIRYLALAVY
jgi:hypothetical protein